jgi:hypothetical protein
MRWSKKIFHSCLPSIRFVGAWVHQSVFFIKTKKQKRPFYIFLNQIYKFLNHFVNMKTIVVEWKLSMKKYFFEKNTSLFFYIVFPMLVPLKHHFLTFAL